MPLVSVYDPAPIRLGGFVASVVYVEELSSHLLAQAFSPTEVGATELAERMAWGIWRTGRAEPGLSPFSWEPTARAFAVYPFAPTNADILTRRSNDPIGVLCVVGHPTHEFLSVARLSMAADSGLIGGPARWDHRNQYTTVRRVPTKTGWSTRDAIDEAGEMPRMRQRASGPRPVDVLATIAAHNDG